MACAWAKRGCWLGLPVHLGGGPAISRPAVPLTDTLARPLRNLRISVTDRCNLRCQYCMPEEEYAWLPREDLLSFEEIAALVDVFCGLGLRRVRLTGGEPLVRKELEALVRLLAQRPLDEIALTTNGVLLAGQVDALKAAGLSRVTVSLDTLRPARFLALTRRDDHARVLEGIRSVQRAGLPGLKLDAVIVRGVNDDELEPLLEFGAQVGAEVRFIEYMDVGGATRWSLDKVLPAAELLARLSARYGGVRPLPSEPSAPAQRYALPDGRAFGLIASTTRPFCGSCDRSRLTADGLWLLCLYARAGTDLRSLLRKGASPAALAEAISQGWRARTDKGAEDRLGLLRRAPLAQPAELAKDPHLEMHTRGG